MSKPQWTPGPWAEHGKGGCECGQIFGPDGNAVICMVFGPGNVGDDGPDCFPNKPSQQANARLIAAAPELYAALEGLWRECEAMQGPELRDDPVWGPLMMAAVTALADAAAKLGFKIED